MDKLKFLKEYLKKANPINKIATELIINSILEIDRKNKQLIEKNNELEKLIKEL